VDGRPEKAVLFCVLPCLLVESWDRSFRRGAHVPPPSASRGEEEAVGKQVRDILQALLDADREGRWSDYFGDLQRLSQNVAGNFARLLDSQAYVLKAREGVASLVAVRDAERREELIGRVCESGGREHELSLALGIRKRTEVRLRALAEELGKDLAEPPILAADLAGVFFRGCLLVGQVTFAELRGKERRVVAAARGFAPGGTAKQQEHHLKVLRDAFWLGGFVDSVDSPRNPLVEMLFGASREWISTLDAPTETASDEVLEPQWPPARMAWYSGYTQGMEAARLMRMGPDAPLFSIDTALSFVMPPLCQEVCALRAANWSHFFVTHLGLGWWKADGSEADPGKRQWREAAQSAVLLHAKSLVVAELYSRLGGLADKAALETHALSPLQRDIQAAGEQFARALEGLSLAPSPGQKPRQHLGGARLPLFTLDRAPVDVLSFTTTCFAQAMTRHLLPRKAAAEAEKAWQYYALSARGAAAALALQAVEDSTRPDPREMAEKNSKLADSYLRHHGGCVLRHHFPNFFAREFFDRGARDLTVLLHAGRASAAGETTPSPEPLALAQAASLMGQQESASKQRKSCPDGMRRWVYGFLHAWEKTRNAWQGRHPLTLVEATAGLHAVAKKVVVVMGKQARPDAGSDSSASHALTQFAEQAQVAFAADSRLKEWANATILGESV
jgi:hypothetical protein